MKLCACACACVCLGFSSGGRRVDVRYVDLGSDGSVPVTALRRVKDEFFALPIMVRKF